MAPEKRNIFVWFFLLFGCGWLLTSIASCGKAGNATPQGLNIQYQLINLSPDLFPVQLFINNQSVASPAIYGVNQGYFYLPSTVLPFQVRSARNTGTTFFLRNDILQTRAKYTLYIVGSVATNDTATLFTVDTAVIPPIGTAKMRFINLSPTATGGLDVYANGTMAFKKVGYKTVANWITLPVGNYDLQIDPTGTNTILNERQPVTIQDGRLYTLYAYGYSSRPDSAAFNAAVTINR